MFTAGVLSSQGRRRFSSNSGWDLINSEKLPRFSVTTQATIPSGFAFKADGTKLYVIDTSTASIFQYTLTTPWKINTSVYDSVSLSVSAIDTSPQGITFKPDGTRMYVTGYNSDLIQQYTLSTPWDLSTASTSGSFSVLTQTTTPSDIHFKADGTTVYISSPGVVAERGVYQYSLSTAWDISTASFVTSFKPGSSYVGVLLSATGNNLLLLTTTGTVTEYALSTAWNISTAGSVLYTLTTFDTTASSLCFNNDGTKLYTMGTVTDAIQQYTLPSAYTLATAPRFIVNSTTVVTAQSTATSALQFSPDGTRMFAASGSIVYSFNLSVAWDLTTAAYDSFRDISGITSAGISDMFFKPDGTKLFVINSTTDVIYELTMSTAWSITGLTYSGISFSVATQEASASGIYVSPDGLRIFIVGTTNDTVYKYTMSSAWDLSTASYSSNSFSISAQDGTTLGLFMSNDGKYLYIAGSNNDTVYQYNLSTAWDLSTAVYNSISYPFGTVESNMQSLFFKPDGKIMFVLGNTANGKVHGIPIN